MDFNSEEKDQRNCVNKEFSSHDSKPKREVKRDTSWRLEIAKKSEISSSPNCLKPMKPVTSVEKVEQKSKYWRKPVTPKEISKENLLEQLDSVEVETEEESVETASPVKPPKLAEIDSDEELLKSEIKIESKSPGGSKFDKIFAKKDPEGGNKSGSKVSQPFKKVSANSKQKSIHSFFKKI